MKFTAHRDFTILAALMLLHLVPLGFWACTPAQTANARASTLDWARCASAPALQQLTTWVGSSLIADDWERTWKGALVGSLTPAVTCALGVLASQIPSAGDGGISGPEARIQTLAELCQDDLRQVQQGTLARGEACKDPRWRAAWILWKERAAGRLLLAPSGEG